MFLLLQIFAAGVGPFDSLSMTSDFSKWRGGVVHHLNIVGGPKHFSHSVSVIVSFEQIAKQGQCFLCYVQWALDLKVLSFLFTDKVKLNSDVGSW